MGMTRVRTGPVASAVAATALYTVPSATKSVLKEITVNNTSAGALTFTISIGADAAGTELYTAYPIAANGSLTFWHQLPMCAAELLCAKGSSTALAFTIGVEENTL